MLRQLWWQPFFSPGVASVVTATASESWAFPVTIQRPLSSTSWVHGIPEWVESGHKEG